MSEPAAARPWYTRIGPGLITACVVIGPGSILTSSSVGAKNGYSMLWVVVLSVVFMLTYMTLGARLGVVAKEAPCDLIRDKAGKWLAVLVGLCVFFISAAFQSGNNLGVAAAFQAFFDSKVLVVVLVIAFNAFAISFLFAFKNLYRMLERLMMTFVGLMLVCFAINLLLLKPDPVAMARGLVPSIGDIDVALLGLIGTTFVITAAFYQAYLVRQKGWKLEQLSSGLVDARVGSIIMALITIMLMSTAAATFYGQENVSFSSVIDVANGLRDNFGASAKVIFCIGLFSAAYSSFLVNSMIGGFMAADGFGLGSQPTDKWPRILTTLALLTGMTIALAAEIIGLDRKPTIIAAQAVTVLGAPLVAGVLLWLTSRRDIMGDHVNGPVLNTLGGIGLALLVAIGGYTAIVKIPDGIASYSANNSEPAETNKGDDSEENAAAEADAEKSRRSR